MLIDSITPINDNIPEVKIIKIKRNVDDRGYFTEIYKDSDMFPIFNERLVQVNESYSYPTVLRGLHIQWNPSTSKIVRLLSGDITDFILDVRINSPTYGKLLSYNLVDYIEDFEEFIYVPHGFAHGFLTHDISRVQYLYSNEYSKNEVSINIFDREIDCSLCNFDFKEFGYLIEHSYLNISDRDSKGISLSEWKSNNGSNYLKYNQKRIRILTDEHHKCIYVGKEDDGKYTMFSNNWYEFFININDTIIVRDIPIIGEKYYGN